MMAGMSDDFPFRWRPDHNVTPPPWPNPPMLTQIGRGMAGRCPACGRTRLFCGYLRMVQECSACGAPLGRIPFEIAPTYITISIASGFGIALLVLMEATIAPPQWLEAAILLPLVLALSLLLLPPVKGGVLGLMLRLGITEPPQ